jgi:hypothetical protein
MELRVETLLQRRAGGGGGTQLRNQQHALHAARYWQGGLQQQAWHGGQQA